MPITPRTTAGNIIYHVLNRANGRQHIFNKDMDYKAFEDILMEVKVKQPIRILAYCLMPNHWHFVLYPFNDGDLSTFMHFLTLTHAKRWHTHRQSIGEGHLYQGRFKSFPVQRDEHFLQVCRYVERNSLRAKLARKAELWHWSSAWRRTNGSPDERTLLNPWPVEAPKQYLNWLNTPQEHEEEDTIRQAIQRGRPFGEHEWVRKMSHQLGLESTLRPRGRPRRSS